MKMSSLIDCAIKGDLNMFHGILKKFQVRDIMQVRGERSGSH